MHVGFLREVDLSLTSAITAVLGLRAEPCVLSIDNVASGSHPPEGNAGRGERSFEAVHDAMDIARSICSYANQSDVDEVRIAATSKYLWAHLLGWRGSMDLLFRRGHLS